ncbi:hypothetical protein KC976_04105 [Candidatus Saccharibacteria bacterium]|nr:hypothetical protein [Candidatus Saccharibacteria bacterium]MCA9368112.1 hypothetical protein [Candidatus Kaiserbacteria bacterium]
MNIQQAREIFDNYAPKLSASVWFFADEDELRTQHGVPQNVIEAMKFIDNYEENDDTEVTGAQRQEVESALTRIKNKKHTNSDLDLMVSVGLARKVGDRSDEFSGAGIEWIEPSAGNPYSDNYEELFLTRGK